MAELNFPNPDISTVYTQAGITWTWNPAIGVWSTEKFDEDSTNLYLRKDALSGAQTLETSSRTTFTGPLTTGDITLPGGGGPTAAVQRQEVESMIQGLNPGAGVGDITEIIAGDGVNGGGSIGDVTVAVDDTVVRTSGNQTISGTKTFTGTVVATVAECGNSQTCDVTVASGNGLSGGGKLDGDRTLAVGQGDGITVGANVVGVDNTVVRTNQSQTIDGNKTFTSTIIGSINGNAASATITNNLDRKVVAGNGLTGGGTLNSDRTLNVTGGDGIEVSADAVAVNSSVVRTAGNQTIGGVKTFNSSVNLPAGNTNAANALRMDEIEALVASSDVANSVTATNCTRSVVAGNGLTGGGELNNDRTFNVGAGDGITVNSDDITVDSTVVRTTGTQTISGSKTFNQNLSLLSTSSKGSSDLLRKDEIQTLIDNSSSGGGGGNSSGFLSVRDFGAVGDGTTDDTAALTNAFNSGGDGIYFPKGIYRTTSTITVTSGLRLFGDGLESILYFDPPSSFSDVDCLRLEYQWSIYIDNDQFSLADLQILCAPNKVTGTGLKLHYTGENGLVGAYDKLYLTNVAIGSFNGPQGPNGYFQRGFYMLNSAGVCARNLNIYTNTISGDSENNPQSVGIEIRNTMTNHYMIRTLCMDQFYIQRYYNSFLVNSDSNGTIESLYIDKGEVLGTYGFIVNAGSAMTFTNCHVDTTKKPLALNSSSGTIRIIGMDLRSYRGSDRYAGWAIELNSPGTTFVGNFVLAYLSNNGAIICDGSQCEDVVVASNVIQGNHDHSSTAIYTTGGAAGVTFGGNQLAQFGGANSPWLVSDGSDMYVYGQRGSRG